MSNRQLKILVNGSVIGTVSNLQEASTQFHQYVQQIRDWKVSKKWDMIALDEHGARVGGETMYV